MNVLTIIIVIGCFIISAVFVSLTIKQFMDLKNDEERSEYIKRSTHGLPDDFLELSANRAKGKDKATDKYRADCLKGNYDRMYSYQKRSPSKDMAKLSRNYDSEELQRNQDNLRFCNDEMQRQEQQMGILNNLNNTNRIL